MTHCEHCGVEYGVGQSPFCKDGHGHVLPSKGFEPYFNISLGRYVTGWGDIRKGMRQEKVDFRDHPRPGDVSARRDRIEQQKRRERASVDDVIQPPASVTVDGISTLLYDHRERPMRRQIGFHR